MRTFGLSTERTRTEHTHFLPADRHFTDEEKKDKWVRVVAPSNADGVTETREGSGPAPVHSPLSLHATLLSPSTTLSHTYGPATNKSYIHVIQTSGYNTGPASGALVRVNGALELGEGDGVFAWRAQEGDTLEIESVGEGSAEFLVFDIGE